MYTHCIRHRKVSICGCSRKGPEKGLLYIPSPLFPASFGLFVCQFQVEIRSKSDRYGRKGIFGKEAEWGQPVNHVPGYHKIKKETCASCLD